MRKMGRYHGNNHQLARISSGHHVNGKMMPRKVHGNAPMSRIYMKWEVVTGICWKVSKKTPNDAVTPQRQSIHTRDESKRGSAFASIFGVN